MNVRGLKTVRQVGNWVRSRLTDFVLVLGYHRVAHAAADPYGLCVRPDHFAEQLDVLRRSGCVISFASLLEGLRNDTLPRRAIVLTFDDGYQDILHTVQPILASYDVPAGTFIIAGMLGEEFWWDRLARLILDPLALPERLDLDIGGQSFTWTIANHADSAARKALSRPRQQLLMELYDRLLAVPAVREIVLLQLEAWVDTSEALPAPTGRAMSAAELQMLHTTGLVAIGSHGMTHSALPTLSETEQYAELLGSRQALETMLDQPVVAFSYPHGAQSVGTRRLAAEAGYHLACSSQSGIVHRGQDRFALPRFWVPDWDGEQFSRWLGRWL
jgi:peptidoglycan/xylan/chitin deacetylase (PgdA/CDA1 family)